MSFYFILSNKVDNKYFAFTDEAVYIVEQDKFPERLVQFNKKLPIRPEKAFVNSQQTHAFLVGATGGPGLNLEDFASWADVDVVNLKTGSRQNLLEIPENARIFRSTTDFFHGNHLKLEETASGVRIKDSFSGKALFDVNTEDNRLILIKN